MIRTSLWISVLALGVDNGAWGDIHHRCGASWSYTDTRGVVWLADRAYAPGGWGYTNSGYGTPYTPDPVSGTDDDELYRTERYGPSVGYRYDGLPNGIYDVTLKLSELYWTEPGRRVFDIAINRLLCLDDLDIYARVGHDAALDCSFRVKVTDGTIVVSVPQVKRDFAKFAAIAVRTASPDSVPPSAPVGLYAAFFQGSVTLGWPRNLETDLQGYHVYRALESEGPFARLTNQPLQGVSPRLGFLDTGVQPGQTYYYWVTALDASDNESSPCEPVTVTASTRNRDTWPIPACAWSRLLGDDPGGATGRTKRGVPLGGVGAGNFMYNLCGSFGPWELKTGTHEEKFLSAAAFHVYEKVGSSQASVRTLATDDVLPAWHRIRVGEGGFYALYPKAWFVYDVFSTDVSLKQFTPVIPHNYRETSFPVGIFQFRFANPHEEPSEIAVMFTFPNAGYASETRMGFTNRVHREGEFNAVLMKASHPDNTSVTQNTEWCIGTRAPVRAAVSFVNSWNGDGDGSDIYAEFTDDGLLPDRPLHRSNSASAIAVKLTLAPHEQVEIPFVIAWDFPRVKFGEGTEWYRRYTEYFGVTGDHSVDIARAALFNYADWEAQVDRWQGLIIDEPAYPDWLKQAALNELYYDTFGGVFWENGCITKPAESSFGSLPAEDHKYFSMECHDYAFSETFDVRHYEARHYLELWPLIERDVLRWFADYIANDPQGRAPHDAGAPAQDPFFRFSGYGADWQDMPSKFIQQVYAYYHKTHDHDFLDFAWPACKKTYAFMKTRDSNGNRLPDFGNTTYDTWGLKGDNLLCGGLWVGALEALEQLAVIQSDPIVSEVRLWLVEARSNLDRLFWDDALGYYRLDSTSDAIMADGLNGQRYAETTGLRDVLPSERMASHLHRVFEMCVRPLKDFTADGVGDLGAVNGRSSDGSAIGGEQPDEVWTGTTYFVAAMMYRRGKVLGDAQLQERALKTAYGVYYQTWLNAETAYFFNTPEAWSSADPARFRAQQYQRPRAVWELLLEIKNPFDQLIPGELYFPFYQGDGEAFTGFALSNFSERPALLGFTALDPDGQSLSFPRNPSSLQLATHQQTALLGHEIFGTTPDTLQSGWVRLRSDNSQVAGFFQFGGGTRLDGSLAAREQARVLYFTRVFEGPSAFRGHPASTWLSIANPSSQAVTIKLRLRVVEGDAAQLGATLETHRTIAAQGMFFRSVSALFGPDLSVSSGYLEVEVIAGDGVVGFELIRLLDQDTVVGLAAWSESVSREAFSAQLASGPGVFTNLKLVNVSEGSRTVTLRAIADDGSPLASPTTLRLAAGETLSDVDVGPALLGLAAERLAVGSLQVESDGDGIIGDVLFGDPQSLRFAAALPLQTWRVNQAVFSQVANTSDFFTGLALYNPNGVAAEVVIEVFTDQGQVSGRTTFVLAAGQRLARLMPELTPTTAGQVRGYVFIRSTQPMVFQQLFGDMALTRLSAVPATVVH